MKDFIEVVIAGMNDRGSEKTLGIINIPVKPKIVNYKLVFPDGSIVRLTNDTLPSSYAAISNIIAQTKIISEKQLICICHKDVEYKVLDKILNTLIADKVIRRAYKGPNDEKGVWYHWIEETEKGE
jgi:hypothetical protein